MPSGRERSLCSRLSWGGVVLRANESVSITSLGSGKVTAYIDVNMHTMRDREVEVAREWAV